MAVMDLQQMFYSFALDRSLWGYFVVEHPHMGLFNYVRLPQGWLASPAKTKEFMVQILYKFKDNLRRYMDDIVVYATTRVKFMEVLEGVFLTQKFHNFRKYRYNYQNRCNFHRIRYSSNNPLPNVRHPSPK